MSKLNDGSPEDSILGLLFFVYKDDLSNEFHLTSGFSYIMPTSNFSKEFEYKFRKMQQMGAPKENDFKHYPS